MAIVLIGVFLTVGKLAHELTNKDVAFLIHDVDDPESRPIAWLARQILAAVRPTAEDIRRLNQDAGARYVAQLKDAAYADRLLRRFRDSGMDLEALDPSGRWTALQMTVIDNDAAAVRLLIRHGARLDVRDPQGAGLLELAERFQAKLPDQDYSETLALLRGGAATGTTRR